MGAPQPLLRISGVDVSSELSDEDSIHAVFKGSWPVGKYTEIKHTLSEHAAPRDGYIPIAFTGIGEKNEMSIDFRNSGAVLDGLTALVEKMGFSIDLNLIQKAKSDAEQMELRRRARAAKLRSMPDKKEGHKR